MNKNRDHRALQLAMLVLALCVLQTMTAHAQSPEMDAPTAMTSNIIEGEGDGKAETVYYSFTATKGDVKVTVDAKTDDRSTPLRVTLLDADGKELLPIYIVAKGSGAREVGTKRFVRETNVIVRIRMDDDKDVKLLSYKIKLDGAVKIEAPAAAPAEPTSPPVSKTNAGPAPPQARAAAQDQGGS